MLEKLFKLNVKQTSVKTEVIAGITTFLAMAYILGEIGRASCRERVFRAV